MSEIDRILRASLGRRDLLKYGGMAALLAACRRAEEAGGGALTGTTGATGTTAAVHPPITEEPGNLQVFDWAGYGDGTYYPNKEKEFLWADYQAATGDTPSFVLFENDSAGFTDAAAGARYDVVHPCGYRYKDWVDLGAVQPWDTSLIANFSQLNPKLMESGIVDGQQYFIPLDWGFIAPIINADHVDVTEDSFGILFDDRYEGKISWVDTQNMLFVTGMFLGVPDPFDMTDEELAEVRDFLISKKHLVKFLWNQSYDLWLSFQKEEIWIAYAWPDTVGYADADGMNYRYLEPKEGRVAWVCGMGLFADSANYHHAHEYVNSWASTRAAEFMLGFYYYGHTNTQADLSVVSPGIIDALGLDDPTVLEPPRSIPESYIPRRDVYGQIWSEVLAA